MQIQTSKGAEQILSLLTQHLDSFTPQERKAATFILDNSSMVSVSSIRDLASNAGVKPNTYVRMARALGFKGFDEFREPFKETIRSGQLNFPDRARWLQEVASRGELGQLHAQMASSAIENIEASFANTNEAQLNRVANSIVKAKRVFVLGVGVYNTLAQNFAYVASMAMENIVSIPKVGSHLIDDLARAEQGDLVLAMTFKPYRTEVLDAVALAKAQGAAIVGITDSAAAPFVSTCEEVIYVASETPQFFPSTVAAVAILETLMAFIVADADKNIVESIEKFHRRRHAMGVYFSED